MRLSNAPQFCEPSERESTSGSSLQVASYQARPTDLVIGGIDNVFQARRAVK